MAESGEIAEQILQGVTVYPDALYGRLGRIDYDTDLGFLTGGKWWAEFGSQLLLGFGVSGWQQGTEEVANYFKPTTDLDDIDPALVTVDRLGKGIGTRVYNTPQALAATAERPAVVGMYAFALLPETIRDLRHANDAAMAARHAGLKIASVLHGSRQAVGKADTRHGHAPAVLYNQTPSGKRQKKRESAQLSAVPEELMIIRGGHVALSKVGEYHA